MSRKKNGYDDRDADPDMEHGLFGKFVEGVIIFVICCFLVKLGVSYLVSIKIPLIIIAVVLATIFIIYRVCKRRDHDDY